MRILAAEDDNAVRRFLSHGLAEAGYAVTAACDGNEALVRAKSEPFDLFLLDIMMPGLDGVSLCGLLRAHGITAPVLMLTARDRVEDKVQGLAAGADDYLSKPFEFDELLARIAALLRRSTRYGAARLSCADLTLDPATRQTRRAGRNIELSAKEYALLEYLVKNRGRIVAEEEIIRQVWANPFDPLTNVVSVYIHHLRAKIDKGFDKKLLHTVRGAGYLLEERNDG